MKRLGTFLLCLLGTLLGACLVLFLYLSITEYRPEAVQELQITRQGDCDTLCLGQTYTLLSWNTGYAGLGKDSDFFMDGGTEVAAADEATVQGYLSGICQTIETADPDLLLLQEVDSDSSRTYRIDQRDSYGPYLSRSAYALNHSCSYLPYPLPPIGRVNAGLYTGTRGLEMDRAERVSLPCPFSWPVSMVNLKRCLLVSYLPIQGTDRQLVLINLHLEAYDNNEGKIAQTRQLLELLTSEYEKGNYVIAAGDFNQTFPGMLEQYPVLDPDLWTPGILDLSGLGDDWTVCCDGSVPSCRLLNQPYDPTDEANTQYFVIDGALCSPNVHISRAETLDCGFACSDHNPVLLELTLEN